MDFSISKLSESRIRQIINSNSWSPDCPVSIDMLREVHILHKDFNGVTKKGILIVNYIVAINTLNIFKNLFLLEFPIEKAIPIEQYDCSDYHSMADNNSSGFNCRKISNTDKWSSHSYGMAIDINPIQNPCITINENAGNAEILPSNGSKYLNRKFIRLGMVESIVKIFSENQFTVWGGDWNNPLDYHHFQVPWDIINKEKQNMFK